MTHDLPLSRPVSVDTLPANGADVTVEPTPVERERLAAEFGLVSIEELKGTFRVERRGRTAHVSGEVRARVVQTCVVSLEAFPADVVEPVDLRFAEPSAVADADEGGEHEAQVDAPDPIVGGRIDLGAVTAEFLALALDPYPRKPGADFAWTEGSDEDQHPFAALARLKQPKGE